MKAAIQLVVAGSPQIPKQFLYLKTSRHVDNARNLDWNVEEWRHLDTFPALQACRIPRVTNHEHH